MRWTRQCLCVVLFLQIPADVQVSHCFCNKRISLIKWLYHHTTTAGRTISVGFESSLKFNIPYQNIGRKLRDRIKNASSVERMPAKFHDFPVRIHHWHEDLVIESTLKNVVFCRWARLSVGFFVIWKAVVLRSRLILRGFRRLWAENQRTFFVTRGFSMHCACIHVSIFRCRCVRWPRATKRTRLICAHAGCTNVVSLPRGRLPKFCIDHIREKQLFLPSKLPYEQAFIDQSERVDFRVPVVYFTVGLLVINMTILTGQDPRQPTLCNMWA